MASSNTLTRHKEEHVTCNMMCSAIERRAVCLWKLKGNRTLEGGVALVTLMPAAALRVSRPKNIKQ